MSNTKNNFIFSIFTDDEVLSVNFHYFFVQSQLNENLKSSKFSNIIKIFKFTLIILSDYAPSTRENFVNYSVNSDIIEIGVNLDYHICKSGTQTAINMHLVNSILTALLDMPSFENIWIHSLYFDILNLFKF